MSTVLSEAKPKQTTTVSSLLDILEDFWNLGGCLADTNKIIKNVIESQSELCLIQIMAWMALIFQT